MYYVYMLCDPRRDNRPFYVGKGTGDRAKSHLYETYQTTSNRKKWCKIAAIKRAGLNVHIEYITTNLSEQEAYELEATIIKQYGRIGFEENGILTNICEDNRPPSAKGRIASDETRKKLSERQLGSLNHRFGVAWSEEEKEMRRQFNLENGIKPPNRYGIPHKEETKKKMSLAALGKKKSPEHCKAIGDSKRGKKYGPRSAEQKANMSAWQQRHYHFTSPEGKSYHVTSAKLTEFCKTFNMAYGAMMAAVKAERKYKGWLITRSSKTQ